MYFKNTYGIENELCIYCEHSQNITSIFKYMIEFEPKTSWKQVENHCTRTNPLGFDNTLPSNHTRTFGQKLVEYLIYHVCFEFIWKSNSNMPFLSHFWLNEVNKDMILKIFQRSMQWIEYHYKILNFFC